MWKVLGSKEQNALTVAILRHLSPAVLFIIQSFNYLPKPTGRVRPKEMQNENSVGIFRQNEVYLSVEPATDDPQISRLLFCFISPPPFSAVVL